MYKNIVCAVGCDNESVYVCVHAIMLIQQSVEMACNIT